MTILSLPCLTLCFDFDSVRLIFWNQCSVFELHSLHRKSQAPFSILRLAGDWWGRLASRGKRRLALEKVTRVKLRSVRAKQSASIGSLWNLLSYWDRLPLGSKVIVSMAQLIPAPTLFSSELQMGLLARQDRSRWRISCKQQKTLQSRSPK